MIDLARHPFPVAYRELWLPGAINGTVLPSSVQGGHGLTLTGAQKRTTADGVRFTGAAGSNIVVAAAAGQNLQQAFHITIRFKLDQTFAAGAAADQYLFTKRLDANNWIDVWLENADGALYWRQGDGAGGNQFTLTSTTVSWTAGTQYIVTCSLTNTPTQRLIVNNVVEDTDVAVAVATPNGGDMVIGNSTAAGAVGLVGVISWVVIGVGTTAATALTAAEETDLSRGVPPVTAKVQYLFAMDEGRGVTANDRGSAAGNGTIGAACTWAFGQVGQPCLSLDGINDYANNTAAAPLTLPFTLASVVKAKSTYNNPSRPLNPLGIRADGSNAISISGQIGNTGVRLSVELGGIVISAYTPTVPAIGDYLVLISTVSASSVVSFYQNGSSFGGGTTGVPPATATQAILGAYIGPTAYDVSSHLFAAFISGAFNARQALAYSRWLRDVLNLPVSM